MIGFVGRCLGDWEKNSFLFKPTDNLCFLKLQDMRSIRFVQSETSMHFGNVLQLEISDFARPRVEVPLIFLLIIKFPKFIRFSSDIFHVSQLYQKRIGLLCNKNNYNWRNGLIALFLTFQGIRIMKDLLIWFFFSSKGKKTCSSASCLHSSWFVSRVSSQKR